MKSCKMERMDLNFISRGYRKDIRKKYRGQAWYSLWSSVIIPSVSCPQCGWDGIFLQSYSKPKLRSSGYQKSITQEIKWGSNILLICTYIIMNQADSCCIDIRHVCDIIKSTRYWEYYIIASIINIFNKNECHHFDYW